MERNSPNEVIVQPPGAGVGPGAGGAVTHYVSLRQPWASLLVLGPKRLETRSWPTTVRGRLAIHAGVSFSREELAAFYQRPFLDAFAAHGIAMAGDLPRGALIGWVTIENCLRMVSADFCGHEKGDDEICLACDKRLTEQERAFGHYAPDRFAWTTTEERHALKEPIKMRGFQRIQPLSPDLVRRLS